MALNVLKRKPFTPEWVNGLKHVPEAYMDSATIQITEEGAGEPVYLDGQWTAPPPVIIYDGPARVTPRRTALQHPIPGNTTNTQVVQFQIPIDDVDFDLRPKMHNVTVTACANNPRLLNYLFTVSEVVDSSAPIEYTFWCAVDQNLVL